MTRQAAYSHRGFERMGTRIDLWVGGVPTARAESALAEGERFIGEFDDTLSRFKPTSELSRLNADARETVKSSHLLVRLVEAALWAARASNGLIDPTVTPALRDIGYTESKAGDTPASLVTAVGRLKQTKSAEANPRSRWREIQVDRVGRTISRPPGVEIDSGGSGKGLAADLLAERWSIKLGRRARFIIDCGGDIRVGGDGPPIKVTIDPPTGDLGSPTGKIEIAEGAIATSGIGQRIWRRKDGEFVHHLIDPASGESAWTGLAGVTQLAPTTLVAETMAKTAFLSGPDIGRRIVANNGGVLFHLDGSIERVDGAVEAPDALRVAA
ncbi:MAG: FAD:protein FMN transferase [Solirubrobacterales bacterium]